MVGTGGLVSNASSQGRKMALNFNDCVLECCKTPEFIKEYDRLQGSNLSKVLIPQQDTRPPIVRMIDETTGYDKVRTNFDEQAHKEMQEFIGFIFNCVWIPLLFSATNDT